MEKYRYYGEFSSLDDLMSKSEFWLYTKNPSLLRMLFWIIRDQ